MDKTPILYDTTLKRIPPLFILLLILILGFPIVALNFLDMDFSTFTSTISGITGLSQKVETQIRGYFRQTLLAWSAFSISVVTVLLAFTQFRLSKDKISLVIGLAILFSGTVQALQILIVDGLTINFTVQKNLDATIWTFSNILTGIIFVIGLCYILRNDTNKPFRISTLFLLNFLLLLIAFSLIYYYTTRIDPITMWFEYSVLSRPYELIYLLIYLGIIIFLYPSVYKKHPCILTNCIFYMAVTQVVIALYLMTLSSGPYDSGYNIAHFLKVIFYFIPFSCFIINYIYTYNSVLIAQNQWEKNSKKLKYLASHDVLTDLYNRREFETLLHRTLANSQRDGSAFALIMIDIDNFKLLNDTLGHKQGDNFLKIFAENMSNLTREGDVLSRIGGDEFALITGKIKSITNVRQLAERMVGRLCTPFSIHGKLINCTASVGIALFPKDGDNIEDLMKHADIAMYNAKKSGKNTYCFFEEKLSILQYRESQIEHNLRDALKKNELTLCYQPKYNLVTHEIIGAEVLLRWHNKVLGDVSPQEFIPVAEQAGLLTHIGEWILEKICSQAKTWLEFYNKPIRFSINISTVQFKNKLFLRHLYDYVAKYNCPIRLLEIEISENLLVNVDEYVADNLKKLDSIGVNIAVNNFGIGYFSLHQMKSLPIKVIKIDKSFIAEIQNTADKVLIIDAIIKLARELDITPFAEGIESEEQLNYLISRQCYFGQGFYLNPPLNASQFEQLVYNKGD